MENKDKRIILSKLVLSGANKAYLESSEAETVPP
jgi:hypothetical protein